MALVDLLILTIIIIYVARGFANGAIKELVSFIGGLVVIVIAYFLKNPLSVYLYKHLPFFEFDGIMSGVSVINIIIYEILSFLIVVAVLFIVYRVIISITNLIETILKMTVILAIPSKIIGIVVGFVEGVIVTFIILFMLLQFTYTKKYVDESKYGHIILTSTPILSNITKSVYDSLVEIHKVAEKYKDSTDRNAVNLEAFDIILKYKLIDIENATSLVESGKLKLEGAQAVIDKYKNS